MGPIGCKGKRKEGKKKIRNKEAAGRERDGVTGREALERVTGQSKAPPVAAKHRFTSPRLIRDVKMKLKWWK